MKLKLSSWLNRLLPVLLFSISTALLLEPWFKFYYLPDRVQIGGLIFPWIILLEVVFLSLAGRMEEVENIPLRVLLLLGVLAVELVFLLLAGWPLYYFLTISLILVLPALRFSNYLRKIDFEGDLVLGLLLYLINLLIFDIPYIKVLLFFFSVISLAAVLNMQKMSSRGHPGQLKRGFLIIIFFSITVYLSALIFGFSINDLILQGAAAGFSWLYLCFTELVMLVIKPLVWVLTPLITFLLNFWIGLLAKDGRSQKPGLFEQDNGLPFKPPETPADIGFVFWIIFYLLLTGLILMLVFRLKRGKEVETQERGLLEERESLFRSGQGLLQDMEGFIRGIFSRLRRPGQGVYDRSSPLLIMREIYHSFLVEYQQVLPRCPCDTPYEYFKRLKLLPEIDGLEAEIRELTTIYNRARYREVITGEELSRAGELWERIKKERKNRV